MFSHWDFQPQSDLSYFRLDLNRAGVSSGVLNACADQLSETLWCLFDDSLNWENESHPFALINCRTVVITPHTMKSHGEAFIGPPN